MVHNLQIQMLGGHRWSNKTSNFLKNHILLLSYAKSIPYHHLIPFIFQQNSIRQLAYHYDQQKFGNTNQRREHEQDCNNFLYLYKSKGQHLLTNPRVLDTIVCKSAINPTDTVLEIGPGTGNLTLPLLDVASKVIAVEIDKRMVEVLHKRVADHGLHDRLNVSSTIKLVLTLFVEMPERNLFHG